MTPSTSTSETILLTGAGLTKNFGGFLASEMWGAIISNPNLHHFPNLMQLLRSTFDYEEIYHQVTNDNEVSNEEKKALSDAIRTAYLSQEGMLSIWTKTSGTAFPMDIYGFQEMIAGFGRREAGKGFIFTLNQDLLLERHYYSRPHPELPGIPEYPGFFSTGISDVPPDKIPMIDLPSGGSSEISIATCHEFSYIKIHGSINFRSTSDLGLMVIGMHKEKDIAGHPLLLSYFNLFKEVLSLPSRRLLVIGYGFNDPHINEVIADSVKDCGLMVHVLSPSQPDQLFKHLNTHDVGKIIWSGIHGYYQYKLAELFPQSQDKTTAWRDVRSRFFGS